MRIITNIFTFRFMSNHVGNGLGFHVSYKSKVSQYTHLTSLHGHIATLGFTAQNGIITSPLYPTEYPDKVDCIYTIYQPTGTTILLNFIFLDVENDTACGFDYLEIRDGPSEASNMLEKLCGSDADFVIQSSQNKLWMR